MDSNIIIIGGIPCTGKTTVANALSKKINASVFTKDILEAAIVRSGIVSTKELQGVGYELLAVLAQNEIDFGRSVILDCISSSRSIKHYWGGIVTEKTRYIECVCSNKELHKTRIESRVRGIPGWYEITWKDILKIQKTYQPSSENRLILDAIDDLDSNIERAFEHVRS